MRPCAQYWVGSPPETAKFLKSQVVGLHAVDDDPGGLVAFLVRRSG